MDEGLGRQINRSEHREEILVPKRHVVYGEFELPGTVVISLT
jgi:hypothetical protein